MTKTYLAHNGNYPVFLFRKKEVSFNLRKSGQGLRIMDIKSLLQFYNIEEIDSRLGDTLWSPIDVAYVNDWVLRAAAIKGEYHWHSHEDDELFFVYKGEIVIETEKGPITLKEGEGAVIPKGTSHKPIAKQRALILMFEPVSLKSKGD